MANQNSQQNDPADEWKAQEGAYRRGYAQGTATSLDAIIEFIKQGVSLPDIIDMCNDFESVIDNWRVSKKDIHLFYAPKFLANEYLDRLKERKQRRLKDEEQ